MINSIYPYIMGWSTPSPKKIESSFRNLPDTRVDTPTDTRSQGESASLNPLASVESLEMNMSGFAASASLFSDVSDANAGQGLAQMVVYQRGYEANPKLIRTGDETSKHTVDIEI